jgi:trehalose synthase
MGVRAADRLLDLLSGLPADEFRSGLAVAHEAFAGHTVWNVNSTAAGGGVAEMLQSLVPYARGAGVDARWIVIAGTEEFFRVTKRIHNRLHGSPGDGGELGDSEREQYLSVCDVNAQRLLQRVNSGDIVVLHDPQTAGLVPALHEAGVPVVWRCHVGVLDPNEFVRQAWDFLRPFVRPADAYIFSTHGFVWDGLDPARLTIIPPSIDPFAPKNEEITPTDVRAILIGAGLMTGDGNPRAVFTRFDGSQGRVTHRSEVSEEVQLTESTHLILQVSRWDRLKDPLGVMDAFVEYCVPATDAHLLLAGPSVAHVQDDPEGLEVSTEVHDAWSALPAPARARVHLASLQMNDVEENAITVNALQRRADIVVQKSIAEGFGLTVAEAMWKARPVVASRAGGIQDQIEDGRTGLLVAPRDLAAFGEALIMLCHDRAAATQMGRAAHERVRERFLGSRHLLQYLELLTRLLRR